MQKLWGLIADRIIKRALRTPYFHLRLNDGRPYMDRYWLWKPRWWTLGIGARVHKTVNSDPDRALHDHPWPNVSVILRGGYLEVLPKDQKQPAGFDELLVKMLRRSPGNIVLRMARTRHRIYLATGDHCWSLFLIGPRSRATAAESAEIASAYEDAGEFLFEARWRSWGFHTRAGWVFWRRHLKDWTTDPAEDELP